LDVDGNIHASGTIQSGNSLLINGTTHTITSTSGAISFDDENLTTTGNVDGNELRINSGSFRIAEDVSNIPWVNARKGGIGGNKVFEMGLGTNNALGPAGYGLNINDDNGAYMTGMGLMGGMWYNGVLAAGFTGGTTSGAGFYTDGLGTAYGIQIGQLGGTPVFSVDKDGNADMAGFTLTASPSNGYVLVSDGNGVGTWTDPASIEDGDWTVSGNDIYCSVSNNVGIGLTNPSEKLDVDGNIHASGTIQSGNSLLINGTTHTITSTSGAISFDDENLTTTGNVDGNELRINSGSFRIAEDVSNIPWVNARKGGIGGNKVFEMGLGTNNALGPAGYGLNINDDNGAYMTGMGLMGGMWYNGVLAAGFTGGTTSGAGFYTDGLGTAYGIQIGQLGGTPVFSVDNNGYVTATTVVGGSISISGAAITSSTGAISFNDENLSTNGNLSVSGQFTIGGALYVNRYTTNLSTYTCSTSDYFVISNFVGDVTITLPAPAAGRVIKIFNQNDANGLTVSTPSGSIYGSGTVVVLSATTFISDGADWFADK